MMTPQITGLTANSIVEEARRRSGLTDLGDEAFLEALPHYLQSLHEQVGLFSEAGEMTLYEEAVGAIQKRLAIQEFFRQHPEALDERINRPIFITGLYRSGTTRLLNMIGADPRLMHLKSWMTSFPVPIADVPPGEEDPRIQLSQAGLDMLAQRAPHAAAAHPLTAMSPSEEFPLMTMSFRGMDAKHLRTGFSTWLAGQDNIAMYRDLERALKAIQFQFKSNDKQEHRFCLKAPIHLGNLDLLIRQFPDARVLITHRDPFAAIHSFTMVRESLRGLYCDEIDPLNMGMEILEQASSALERSVAARHSLPENAIFDLSFSDIVERLPERLEAIYDFIGLPLTESALKALEEEERHSDTHKSRATSKDPARYGLTRERVYAAMPDYLAFAREHLGDITAA